MAALPYATAVSFRHRFTEKLGGNPVISSIAFSLESPLLDRPTRRINYLRRKILKTLKEPVVPKLPDVEPLVPVSSPPIDGINECEYATEETRDSEKSESGNEVENIEKSMEGDVSVLAGMNPDFSIGMLGGKFSLLKYGFWFLGAFVFQTVCAMLFGLAGAEDSDQRMHGNERNLRYDAGENDQGKSAIGLAFKGVGFSSLDELEVEKKIEEIRIMAREARETESLDSSGMEEDGAEYHRSGIKEEVEDRLIMLRKKLESNRNHLSAASVADNKIIDVDGKGVLDGRQGKGASSFKKNRFRGPSMDPVAKPNGFMGSEVRKVAKSQKKWELKDEYRLNESRTNVSVADSNGKKQQEMFEPVNSDEPAFDEYKEVMPMRSTKKSRKRVNKETGPSKEGKEDDALKSKVINGIDATESNTRDAWWVNLPYVLVVFMRKHGGEEGLYTLKRTSKTEGQVSQVVAFEERADATNFCYLLESFFEDVKGFEADVVPLPVKELNEAVKSGSVRPIVVKKGALRLYAGQPLVDAEMALHAMAEEA